ncbi:MAG: hypothetical protein COB04_01155 [Gammaproteobacteria bacterium]|nr:MAG: hypothetical protein COB04_01155 [Gammaproteobacteria bacterium]
MTHIVGRLISAFEHYGPLTALKILDKKYSYGELYRLSLQMAGYLASEDSTSGAVGILVQRELAAYQGVLGALFANRTYVPINPQSSTEKIKSIVKQANISTLVISEAQLYEYRGLLETLDLDSLLVPELTASSENEAREASLPRVIDQGVLATFEGAVGGGYSDSLYIMFTSGSTGTPKGVPINNRNLTSFINAYQSHFDFEPGFIASQTFDFSFDPSVADLIFTWLHGGQVTALTKEELYCPSDYIVREGIQVWASVPALAEFIRQLGALEENSFPSIERSIFCGEALTKSLAKAWRKAAPNSTLENWYGPTETTIYISHKVISDSELQDVDTNHYVPIGAGLGAHELCIVDANHQLVGPEDKGELVIKGPQLCDGYLDEQRKTERAFVAMPWDQSAENRWYKTGDLVWRNAKGDFCYSGRLDNQIKISGRRIELGEVERCLQVYGRLDPVVVVPIYSESGAVDRLVAYTTQSLDKDQIKEVKKRCRNNIEAIFYPKKIVSISKFPTNFSGKVNRKKLTADANDQLEALPL